MGEPLLAAAEEILCMHIAFSSLPAGPAMQLGLFPRRGIVCPKPDSGRRRGTAPTGLRPNRSLGGRRPCAYHCRDIHSLPRGETVPSTRSGSTTRRNAGGAGASSRSKREEILLTATRYFGENGYEATKLADVAAAVGIGSTALYHYFESKLHCLYVIMADALEFFRSEFRS